MRRLAAALILLLAGAVPAAPPPPPPSYLWDAGKLLADPLATDPASIAPLFAADVVADQNGREIARGKAAWLAWRRADLAHYNGRVLGYSESSGGASESGGELLVFDTFDTVDRTKLPPTFLVDPRIATRSTLYRFGADGLIHFVHIARANGFLMQLRADAMP